MTERTLSAERDADRLDRFLAESLGVSRSAAKRIIDAGSVVRDGKRMTPHDPVRAGDTLVVTDPEPPALVTPPDPSVIAATPDYLVLAKPAGLTVHPAPGVSGPTLVDWLAKHYPDVAALGGDRPGVVHRLDRDVSGVMVVARTAEAVEHFHLLFEGRQVEKHYRALVHRPFSKPEGTLRFRMAHSETRPGRMAARPLNQPGREATTNFVVLGQTTRFAYLDLELVTGRTHQLRAHLAAAGHPIVGDTRYGLGDTDLDRPFLHAATLAFPDLRSVPQRYKAPLPAPLVAVRDQLVPGTVDTLQ